MERRRIHSVLALYRKVYAMERSLLGEEASFAKRKRVRQQKSTPIFDHLRGFLESNAMIGAKSWK